MKRQGEMVGPYAPIMPKEEMLALRNKMQQDIIRNSKKEEVKL